MELRYGKEPADSKLLTLLFLRKIWIPILTTILGVVIVGGTYFLLHVVYGPAQEYEAVTDFYIDYAKQESGEEYTYFNQTTWTQLMQDDVFVDRIHENLLAQGIGEEEIIAAGPAAEETELLTGEVTIESQARTQLASYLYATMLSDTRIVTTTVTTNQPEMTMAINGALIDAMEQFAQEQKEIAGVRILEEPEEASLVVADVRTLRACILGGVVFLVITLFVMWLMELLDDSIVVPATIEKRYAIPAVGTIHSVECEALIRKLFHNSPVLITGDPIDLLQVKEELAKKGIICESVVDLSSDLPATKLMELDGMHNLLLVVKAEAHNGRCIEKTISLAKKSGGQIAGALLWEADEKLVQRYEAAGHVLKGNKDR